MFMKRVYDPQYFEGKHPILKYISTTTKDKTLFHIPIKSTPSTTYEVKPKKEENKLT